MKDDNPYQPPQVEHIEAPSLAGAAADSQQVPQYGLLDSRVHIAALMIVVLAFGLPFVMAVIVGAWFR